MTGLKFDEGYVIMLFVRAFLYLLKGGTKVGKDLRGKELGIGLSQRQDGRYQARFESAHKELNGDRIRVCKTFKKLVDARNWLAESKYKDAHSYVTVSATISVREIFNLMIDTTKKGKVKDSTLQQYTQTYNSMVDRWIGTMSIQQVKMLQIQQLLNVGADEGYSEGTLQNTRSLLYMLFDFACANDIIDKNPVNKLCQVPKVASKNQRIKVLSPELEEKFLKSIYKTVNYGFSVFILNTGMRFGEVASLTWKDIDFNNMEINVNKTTWYDNDEKKLKISPPKSKSGIRMIPITPKALEILQNQRRLHDSKIVSFEYGDLVFPSRNGTPMRHNNLDSAIRVFCKRNNEPRFSAHTLRHTFATRCVEAGMDYKVLQEILGHSSLRMTMDTYVHPGNETKHNEMQKVFMAM